MLLQRAALPVAAALAVGWYVRRRALRSSSSGTATPHLGGRPSGPASEGEDPLDRLAEEVESRSDATDVVTVVEDLLSASEEEQRRPG